MWHPVVSRWSPIWLVYAREPSWRQLFGGKDRAFDRERGIAAVLEKISRRKGGLPRDFDRLYYRRSGSVWSR